MMKNTTKIIFEKLNGQNFKIIEKNKTMCIYGGVVKNDGSSKNIY